MGLKSGEGTISKTTLMSTSDYGSVVDDRKQSDSVKREGSAIKADPVVTTWRNWLIGPIAFLFFYGFISSFYLVLEYTNKRCLDDAFLAANLSEKNISSHTCSENTTGAVYETETRATEKASRWILYYSVAQGIPAIISNLVLGSYTDTWGRKFLLVIGIVGTTLRLLATTAVIYLEGDLFYLLLALLIDAFTGNYATALQTTLAYVADITSTENRTLGMIFIETILGLGLSSASFATGYLIGAYGYVLPIILCSAVLLFDLVLVLVLLPETLGKDKRRKKSSVREMIQTALLFVLKDDGEKKRWKYQIVFLVYFLCNLSFLSRIPVETLYQMASPFCWSAEKVGVYAALRTVAIMGIGMGLVSQLKRCLEEVTLCILGVISYMACFYWTAFVQNDLEWYLIVGVGCLGAVAPTMARSIISLLTTPDKQGAVFSAVAVLEALSLLLSSVITNAIYTATVSTLRGFVFLVLGSYNAVCLILLIILKTGWNLEKRGTTINIVNPKTLAKNEVAPTRS